MTDIIFTRTALTEAAEGAGVTTAQARIILEAAGVTVEPEKPALPTEPGSAIIATEVRGVKGSWAMMLDRDGDWCAGEVIDGVEYHRPKNITKWTKARIVPVTSTPVTLTEDQVGELWGKESVPLVAWSVLGGRNRERITATVNSALTQYAAPAEGEQIDLEDVREGDRVRVELVGGEKVELTVDRVTNYHIISESIALPLQNIRAVHLLHREEA